MTIKEARKHLIDNSIFRVAVHGAFQRNNVYSKKLNSAETKEFKKYLKIELSKVMEKISAKENYSDRDHYVMIAKFSERISKRFPSYLSRKRLNIGTAQKMLNLYWKMKWLFYPNTPVPIHCPFDGIVIKTLDASVRQVKWTRLDDINLYKELVAAAKKKSGNESIAHWELKIYNTGNKIVDTI